MSAYRYLPDGSRVTFPDETAAQAAAEQCPDLATVSAWRSHFGGTHPDLYPPPAGLSS